MRASIEFIDGCAGAAPPTMTSEWCLGHAIEVSLVQMSLISLPRRPSPLLSSSSFFFVSANWRRTLAVVPSMPSETTA